VAIVILGKTICHLCGRTIEVDQEIVAFSPFVSNEADPLFVFNDEGMHASCFLAHPLADAAQRRYNEIVRANRPGNRKCRICGREIDHPDDYLGLGHLTEDRWDLAYKLNYAHFHRTCLRGSPELARVKQILAALQSSGRWSGPALGVFLSEIDSIERNGRV
jgi:hypothetical protein